MTIPNPVLKDKVAVVTGASRGIGRAIARAYAREGAAVVICGRKQETLDQVAAEISGRPGRVYPLACHVGRADQIQHLVETANHEFGRIDVLVNNAATNIAQEPVLQIDEGKFDKMIEVNLKSAFRLIQTVLSEYYWKDAAKREKILEEQPVKHLGQPEEIAEMAVLLASDRGSYITGQTMIVDGGRLLP
jgi:NAD(P)-dependent dehydrogenase (short-subunit alcohol dehydrogenase family)